jgi:putative IMPACT (imprinted ancient) family translation regulator
MKAWIRLADGRTSQFYEEIVSKIIENIKKEIQKEASSNSVNENYIKSLLLQRMNRI